MRGLGAYGGVMTPPRVLEPQCEWTAADFADKASFTEQFTDAELAELDASLRHALAHSDDVLDLRKEDFPLPGLSARLKGMERELFDGRGFLALRGITGSAYSQE